MYAKWLIGLAMLSLLVLAGCPEGDGGASNENREALTVDGAGDAGGGGEEGGGE